MENCGDASLKAQWADQKDLHKKWQSNKAIEKLKVGDKVDIRDKEYVWCEGVVKLILESIGRDALYVVEYIGFSEEDVLFKNSNRLALYRALTSRNDIPKYKFKNENGQSLEEPQVINRIQTETQAKEEQAKTSPVEESSDKQDTSEDRSATIKSLVEAKLEQMRNNNFEEFFEQFEEQRVEQQKMERWASQEDFSGSQEPVTY